MRLLLDYNVPPKLGPLLVGHTVTHVRDHGWSDLLNGQLVAVADGICDVLVTADRNMPYQTSLKGLSLAVAVLVSKSNRLEDLARLVPALLSHLEQIEQGAYVLISVEQRADPGQQS